MPAREINPFTALTGIRSQFLRTQWRAIISEWTRLRLRPLSHRGWLFSVGRRYTNKAIRDGRPRPPRHQVGWDIVRREYACQISWWSVEKWRRYYILEFRGNTFRWLMTLTFDLKFWKYLSVTEKSYSMCMSSFMMIGWEMAEILHIEISWKHVSVTYDLDLWPKILKIFVSHGVPIRNMYAKFHNDRLRNGWDITLWNFAKTRTKHGQTHKQTDMGITIPRPPPMGGEVIIYISQTCYQMYANINALNRAIYIYLTILSIFVYSPHIIVGASTQNLDDILWTICKEQRYRKRLTNNLI